VDGCQSWKLALETSANFVATRAGKRRWNLVPLSGAGFQREFPASVSWALVSALFLHGVHIPIYVNNTSRVGKDSTNAVNVYYLLVVVIYAKVLFCI